MNCPLCGAHNDNNATFCKVCDSVFSLKQPSSQSPIVLETSDAITQRISWKKLGFLLCFLIAFGTPWFLMSDLFEVPAKVASSRKEFAKLSTNYAAHKEIWDHQKDQILAAMEAKEDTIEINKDSKAFADIPLEVFLSFLINNLGFSFETFPSITIYPDNNLSPTSILLSKREPGPWPFPIILSMELELFSDGQKLLTSFHRLKRGQRDIPEALAWVYFEEELRLLQAFEQFLGGTRSLRFSRKEIGASTPSSTPIVVDWEYLIPKKALPNKGSAFLMKSESG